MIDYPERRHCCGFGFRQYLIKESRGYSLSHAQIKFESMQLYHPDFILTNCPGCNMFMDRWQYVIQETAGKVYSSDGNGIPVLSYEELAALLLGYDPIQIGLFMHQTEVLPLLEKLGIQFDKNEYSKLRAESHHNTKFPDKSIKIIPISFEKHDAMKNKPTIIKSSFSTEKYFSKLEGKQIS